MPDLTAARAHLLAAKYHCRLAGYTREQAKRELLTWFLAHYGEPNPRQERKQLISF